VVKTTQIKRRGHLRVSRNQKRINLKLTLKKKIGKMMTKRAEKKKWLKGKKVNNRLRKRKNLLKVKNLKKSKEMIMEHNKNMR
jgi:hypothetical protein